MLTPNNSNKEPWWLPLNNKIVEFIPNKKVVWLVMDNYFSFTKDKSEWKGNKIMGLYDL